MTLFWQELVTRFNINEIESTDSVCFVMEDHECGPLQNKVTVWRSNIAAIYFWYVSYQNVLG